MQRQGPAAAGVHRRRAAALEAALGDRVGGLLVTGQPDVRYLSGFTGSNGWLLLGAETAILLTDPRYREQAPAEASGWHVHIAEAGLAAGLAELDLPAGSLAFQATRVSVATFRDLEDALPEVTWVDRGEELATLRRRKGPEEVAAVRRALALSEEVLVEAVAELRPGRTELELAADLEFRCRCRGAEAMSFPTIVAAADHAALPHARPRARRLEAGDAVLVDMGCVVDGYCSDITRMISLGTPAPRWRRWHAAVDRAVEAALEAARPGVACAAVDAAARESLASADLQETFVHGLGHGVGLEVHEGPRLSSRSDDVLEEGMLFTIEPGVYLPGRGGVRLEEMVVMAADGPRRLNALGRDFLVNGAAAS